jgi:predicted MFS family arabinose efflux permease
VKDPGNWPLVPAICGLSVTLIVVGFLSPLLLLMANDFGVSLGQAGQLAFITAIPWAIAAPFSGLISDRLGRRPVIVVALVGMGFTTIAGSFATVFWLLVVLRALTGLFASGGPPAILAGIAEIYPAHRRGSAFGWANSCYGWSALLGVPLAGAIGGLWGWRVAFLCVGLALNPIRAYRYLFGTPHLGTLLVANVFQTVIFIVVTLYFATLLMRTYALSAVSVAPALALIAVGTLIGTVGGGLLADRFSHVTLASAAIGLAAVFGAAAFAWPIHVVISLITGFGFSLLIAACRAPLLALLLGRTDHHHGALTGLYATSNQIGIAIGAGIGGIVFDAVGSAGVALLVCAVGLLSAVLVLGTRSAVTVR